MPDQDDSISRRALVRKMGIALSVCTVLGAAGGRRALAAATAPASGPALPHVDPKDPVATALGYVVDATKVEAAENPTYKAGQSCASCLQLQGKPGETWRPCLLFPGKLVNSGGWCRSYVKKP